MPAHSIDWRDHLDDMLINAGTTGLKQREIVARMQNLATAGDIAQHLTALLAEDKVQRFVVPSRLGTGGRPATWWRATHLILESD